MEVNSIVTHFDVEDKLNDMQNLLETLMKLNYQYPMQQDILNSINDIYCAYRKLVCDINFAMDNISIVVKNYK